MTELPVIRKDKFTMSMAKKECNGYDFYYQDLMKEIRKAIIENRIKEFREEFYRKINQKNQKEEILC